MAVLDTAQIIYVNPKGKMIAIDGVINGTNFDFEFNEPSFVVALFKNGIRHTSTALENLEMYACTVHGHQFEVTTGDYTPAGRFLTIANVFFFELVEKQKNVTIVSSGQVTVYKSILNVDDTILTANDTIMGFVEGQFIWDGIYTGVDLLISTISTLKLIDIDIRGKRIV